jgi:hypothetical protein
MSPTTKSNAARRHLDGKDPAESWSFDSNEAAISVSVGTAISAHKLVSHDTLEQEAWRELHLSDLVTWALGWPPV